MRKIIIPFIAIVVITEVLSVGGLNLQRAFYKFNDFPINGDTSRKEGKQ